MANAYYTEALNDFAKGDLAYLTDDFKVYLLTSGYSFSAAHTQYSDFSANIIDSASLAGKAVASGGQCDASDTTLPSVAGGSTIAALLIGRDAGASVVRPVVFLDSYTNLPAATNGNDVIITWPAYIFEV
jgi:hypothetical protein